MKIVIITQNEPFYLAKNLRYLIDILPVHSKIVGCVVSEVSPFGKKESFIRKARKTLSIFGWKFFTYYAFKFIWCKLSANNSLKKLLREKQIPEIKLDHPINHKDSVKKIKRYQPDLLISILGNQIFKAPIINLAPKGCLNLHSALLPKYRGLMPTFWVLKNDEKYTGVSVFYVDEGIDSGPILVQKRIKIGDMTQAQLIDVTKKLGMEAIAEAIDLIYHDRVELIENNDAAKSYYSFPRPEDVKVFLDKGKKFF